MSVKNPKVVTNTVPILRLFLIFVAISTGLFLLMTLLILIPKIDNAFDSLQNQADKAVAEKGATTIRQYLNSKELVLKDIASNPLVPNSVLLGEGGDPAFRDFISSTSLLGEDPILTVLDIEGNVLFSERDQIINYKWVLPIVRGDVPLMLNVDNTNGSKFELAIPILYMKGIEGVIVACFSAMPEMIFDNTSRKTVPSAFAYSVKGNNVRSDDASILLPHEENFFISKYGIEFTHISDRENVLEQKNMLLSGFALSSFIVAILGFILLFFLGRKIIIRPYEELATTQKTLLNVNMELEEFSYRASHDLKAPLINISGLSKIIKEDLEDKDYEEVRTNINRVERLSLNLANLTDDLLAITQIENEEGKYERVNIVSKIAFIKENLRTLISEKQILVQVAVDEGKTIWTKKAVFYQVLENLISNSIKYSDPQKTTRFVKVEAKDSNEGVTLYVSDNGLGIPEEYLGELFGMFKRFHKSTSFGSGLGLYLVKKNLDRIGGEISVKSSPEGTVFTIFFPNKIRD
jgi:signal transduction histidine kinase